MSSNDGKRSSKANNDRPVSPVSLSESDNESLPEIECKLCNKSFDSYNAYQQHIKSRKHYNQMTAKKMSAKAAVDKLVEDHSESDGDDKYTELNCDVCSKTFSGCKPYASHLHGSTHAKNLKKQALKEKMKDVPGVESDEGSGDDWMPKTVAKCKLCEKEFTSLESFQKHLSGSMHKKKLKQEKILQSVKDEHKGSDVEMDDDFYKKCDVCDKEFSGLLPYQNGE
ncbi:zinc finger protein 346 [Parasteatoda tepidariorum]|uniref:zinc finger protein 346 n=1 Tax=Parasteatoda tepidariorum TaxID=114398 RepID=UPI001C71B3F9|nr:zinc finger protein 346 [Parasteatoda tepidariorum]